MISEQPVIQKVNLVLIFLVLSLLSLSLLTLYSLGQGSLADLAFFYKQLAWAGIGLAALIVFAFFNYNRFKHLAWPLYLLNNLFLAIISLVGKSSLGAQRWLELGGLTFQPSEFAKLTLILVLATYLSEQAEEVSWKTIFVSGLILAVPGILILTQPDLGTSLVLAAIFGGLLLVGKASPRQLAVLFLLAAIAVFLAVQFNLLHEYQIKRLTVFLNPEGDPLGSGYNLKQSIIAVGSGQIKGKGLFSGTQSRLNFLPPAAKHTDFIFSVFAEETGFLGSALLIGLYFLLFGQVLSLAVSARDYFGLLLAAGIVSMWLFQTAVNIGMTIGIMPVTGIPLPFFSYGGSSIIMNLTAVGILLNIYARRFS